MSSKTNRRDFIKLSTLAGSGLLLPSLLTSCNSCQDDQRFKDIPLLSETDDPFEVWRQMIELLEKSPDHYIGRYKALIAAKDPQAMTDFIREDIQLLPTGITDFMRNLPNRQVYGLENALRCGMATPHEKAQLLKNMLTEAGFEARVIKEKIAIDEKELKAIVFRNYRPEFAPPINKKQVEAWRKTLGAQKDNGAVQELKNPEKMAQSVADKILKNIDRSSYKKEVGDFRLDWREVPSVALTVDGEEKYAHVFDPAVPFGELHPKNEEGEFGDVKKELPAIEEEVTLTLSCRTALNSGAEQELLTGTWKMTELVGSMLFLKFMNNLDFKQQVTHTISQIDSFTPVFSFQKFGVDKAYMEERSVVGDPIDLNGMPILPEKPTEKETTEDLVSSDATNSTEQDSLSTAGENPVDTLQNEVKDSIPPFSKDSLAGRSTLLSGNLEDIDHLEVNALPKTFPKVLLEISPTDKEGNIIGGLEAKDFIIHDNGKTMLGKMTQNQLSPKLLLLYDTSASMPNEYYGKENMEAFQKMMIGKIKEVYPHTKVTLQPTGSALYTTMLKAKQSDFDIVLYCTDGDNEDRFDPAYTPIYESGQPIIILEVRKSSGTYTELQENIKNLVSVPAVDYDSALDEVAKIVANLSFPPYIISYSSFDEEAEHRVQVKLQNTALSAEAKFKFPEPHDEFIGDRIVGLYLQVQSRGFKVKRTLAGWDQEFYDQFKPSQRYIQEVHEMLLGELALCFEREAPSLSIQLSEYLQAMLSHEKWLKAQQEGDTEKAIEYLEEGTLAYPPVFLSTMQALPNAFNEDHITYPTGMRIGIQKIRPGLYHEQSQFGFDYLPTAQYMTISKSGKEWDRFTENLKKTLEFAVLESAIFKDSTLTQLEDKPLLEIGEIKNKEGLLQRMKEAEDPVFEHRIYRERGTYVFFDESLQASAYFKVEGKSGEAYALLPDGTGGGANDVEAQLEEIQKVVDGYQRLISGVNLGMSGMNPVSGFPLGIVAAYSVTLVKLYAAASEALVVMDTGDLDENVKKALAGLACDLYKSIFYLSLGPVGGEMSGLENLIGLMGGNFSFIPCSA